MRKLLALLLLAITSPAVAQQVDWSGAVNVPNVIVNPSMNDCPSNTQSLTCGAWQTTPGPGDWTNQFGSTEYVFSYVNGMLFQDIDLSDYKTKQFNFIFQFDLNNSCRNSIGGSCGNVNGPVDEFSARIKFYDENGLNNEFTFLSGNPSTANIVCDGLDLFGLCLLGYSAQDNWEHFGWYSSVESDVFFSSARIEFTGRDVGFWAGLYGPRVDNPTLEINYLQMLYWIPVAYENGTFTVDTTTKVRYGAEGVFTTQTFEPGTYSCSNATFGDPIGGVVKYCEIGSLTEPVGVNCALDPFDPSCVLNTLNIDDGVVDYSNPTEVAAASQSTASTDTSTSTSTPVATTETPTQSTTTEIVANTSAPVESFSEKEKASDPVLAASVASEAVANAAAAQATNPLASTPGTQAAYRELTDEEKAAILADAISKNVIEGALTTIAATSAASASNGSQDGSTSTTTTKKDTSTDNTVDANSVMIAENNQSAQTETTDTSGGLEILETGRVKAQESIAATMAATENSANESMSQAESIASNSSVASYTVNNVDEVMTNATASSNFVENKTADVAAAESVAQAEAIALASIEASKPTQSAFEDTSNTDADLVNTMIDPALAMSTVMNNVPNVANLEILGVIGNGNKPEEKSDAEKRAAEVVAANQQQMEEINKNYMEADQSGIVAAMGADTDVNSYRTTMISDAAQWYRDKDIYKGVIIKDNVRGSYFLEKGNTDIYKKMVEEQYK